MHEYPITCHLVDLVCRLAAERGAARIRELTLVIGDDAGYVGDSIRLYFDAVAEGTACAGAEVTVIRIRPQLCCPACGRLFERKPFSFACPECGTDGHPTRIGKEFYLKSIVVETDDGGSQQVLSLEPNGGNSGE